MWILSGRGNAFLEKRFPSPNPSPLKNFSAGMFFEKLCKRRGWVWEGKENTFL
jgi:hypothetical protein